MNEKKRSGLKMIKSRSFYSNDREKIKINWFCYELAMGIYDEIQKRLGRQLKKYKISDEALAGFSVYISKNIKSIISQTSGEIVDVRISDKMIGSYFPNIDSKFINRILDSISKAWEEQISFCKFCPTKCINEKDVYCTMFDDMTLIT
ncbi:MAG: hypothetical protein HPY61_14665 [Methanotrichaceae archaeon]|nr:hypothetical protein [Methanotrichaceae archaeon]